MDESVPFQPILCGGLPSARLTALQRADYLRRVETGEEAGAYEELTPREREILKLIAEGYTSAEIGDLLHLSVKTVQAHRQHIMEKLDLHRPAQLIKYAIRKGLVEADS